MALWACSPVRPDPVPWQETWTAIRARVPDATALSAPDGHPACEQLLVAARRARAELLPTPDPAMDAAVAQWIDTAGAIAFDCPGESGRVQTALEELHLIEAEVDASLALVRGAPGAREGGEGGP